MKIGYNPHEAKAAEERLRQRFAADKKFLEAQRSKAAVSSRTGGGLGFKIEKAKAKRRLKSQQREEKHTLRDVAATRRKETDALRRTQQTSQRAAAEQKLTMQVKKQHEALAEQRAAQKARLLTEKELHRAQMEPYAQVARQAGRGAVQVGKGATAVGKALFGGLQKLSVMGEEYHKRNPDLDPFWGTPRSPQVRTPERYSSRDDTLTSPRPRKDRPFIDIDLSGIMR